MALPPVEIEVTANTEQAQIKLRQTSERAKEVVSKLRQNRLETYLKNIDKAVTKVNKNMKQMGTTTSVATKKLDAAAVATDRISRRLSRTTSRARAFQLGIQNTSFQLGDLAVQMGNGTAASVALSQQLPQLIQGFGIWGAVIGAVVAVAFPLAKVLKNAAESGTDVAAAFGVLEPVMRSIVSVTQNVVSAFGDVLVLVVNNLDRLLIAAGITAAFFAGRWVRSIVAARVATMSLAATLAATGSLFRRFLPVAIVLTLTEIIVQVARFTKAAGGLSEALSLVGSLITELFTNSDDVFFALQMAARGAALSIQASFLEAILAIDQRWGNFFNKFVKSFNDVMRMNNIPFTLGEFETTEIEGKIDELNKRAVDAFGVATDTLGEALPSLERIKGILASIKDEGLDMDSLLGGGEDDDDGSGSLEGRLKRIQDFFAQVKALTQGHLSDRLGAWGSYFSNLVSMTGSSNQRILALSKSFLAAQALMDAWGAYNKVLNSPEPMPFWARLAAGAQVLAAGLGAVSAIRSVSQGGAGGGAGGATPGTTGVGSTGGGTSSGGLGPLDVFLNLQGVGNPGDVADLFDRLNDEAGDRGLSITVAR